MTQETTSVGVVAKFHSEATGRKLFLLYENGVAVRYSLIGRHNFKDYGTIKNPEEIGPLKQWVEGFSKLSS